MCSTVNFQSHDGRAQLWNGYTGISLASQRSCQSNNKFNAKTRAISDAINHTYFLKCTYVKNYVNICNCPHNHIITQNVFCFFLLKRGRGGRHTHNLHTFPTWAISSGVVTGLDMALSWSVTQSTANITPENNHDGIRHDSDTQS